MKDETTGRVVATHGRHFVVRSIEGERIACVTRGKKAGPACGDNVRYSMTGDAQGVIDAIQKRSNLFYRSDAFRTKLLAANLTQLCTVVAADPTFSEDLLGRSLVAAEAIGIKVCIILNKVDLLEASERARARLALYARLGYTILEISVRTDPARAVATLHSYLAGETTLLLGQSGMGKSSLLNALVPDAKASTREISEALHSGKHTTTDARLYDLPDTPGILIDTPGFQEFGLAYLTKGAIERSFPEMRPFLGRCKFYNCTHLVEPGCAVRAAVLEGQIAKSRYALFIALTRESRAESHATPGLG